MDAIFDAVFPRVLFGKPYQTQLAYITDLVKQAELTLTAYLQLHSGSYSAVDRLRGVIITQEQVQKSLCQNRDMTQYHSVLMHYREKASFLIESRLEKTKLFLKMVYLADIFKLNDLEQFYFILCLMPYFEKKYEHIFGFLQNDVTQIHPSCELAIQLYHFTEHFSEIPNAQKLRYELQKKFHLLCFEDAEGTLDAQLLQFVMFDAASSYQIPFAKLQIPEQSEQNLPAMGEIVEQLVQTISSYTGTETLVFYLHGASGAGKRTLATQTAGQLDMAIVHADVRGYAERSEIELERWMLLVCRQVLLQRAFLCLEGILTDAQEDVQSQRRLAYLLSIAKQFCGVIFLCAVRERHVSLHQTDIIWMDCPVPLPDKPQSIALWSYYMQGFSFAESIPAHELANKFRFTPGQIAGTMEAARNRLLWSTQQPLDRATLSSCAYEQIVHTLGQQATLLYANYSMEQLILADDEKEMLQSACDQIRLKHIVYDQWGFNRRLTYGRGVSMLFAGPPGTGKTMAAQVVAKELNIEIYKVDLSQIVSKYIGETEKNLNALFQEAQKSNVILFFDETDALLGKRTEVKDSHDKNANLETSYLLQKMEEYEGITIMTTNYLENIDSAFFRRISYVIHFPFPDEAARLQLWKTIFPQELPQSDEIDYAYLARQFEIAGGNIKNTAVTAAFLAAKNEGELQMQHIMKALKYEMTKQGKIMLAEDFGEYSYLL